MKIKERINRGTGLGKRRRGGEGDSEEDDYGDEYNEEVDNNS